MNKRTNALPLCHKSHSINKIPLQYTFYLMSNLKSWTFLNIHEHGYSYNWPHFYFPCNVDT